MVAKSKGEQRPSGAQEGTGTVLQPAGEEACATSAALILSLADSEKLRRGVGAPRSKPWQVRRTRLHRGENRLRGQDPGIGPFLCFSMAIGIGQTTRIGVVAGGNIHPGGSIGSSRSRRHHKPAVIDASVIFINKYPKHRRVDSSGNVRLFSENPALTGQPLTVGGICRIQPAVRGNAAQRGVPVITRIRISGTLVNAKRVDVRPEKSTVNQRYICPVWYR